MDETAKQAFQIFDMEHKGRFTFEMLKKVARDVGEEWSEAEMREMFDMADQNEDGMIDRDEFIIIMERIGLS
jgi:calcium-binding protein CML